MMGKIQMREMLGGIKMIGLQDDGRDSNDEDDWDDSDDGDDGMIEVKLMLAGK